MPTRIPDRYQLEIRLGRDGDIEEWLAADTSLDRPVLVRSLGPDSGEERRRQFVSSVSGAAKAHHPHLAKIFVVEEVEGGAYSVVEWTGGSTVADRIGASYGIELDEFLPNATGLAAALAELHAAGAVHGSIDLSSISYTEARPAKLTGFGRPFHGDADNDVRALSAVLETALTGEPPGGPPPSESIDGISPQIDRILRSGQAGAFTAEQLEKALRAAPSPKKPRPEPKSFSRRLLVAAGGLVILAVGLVGLGALFGTPASPIIPSPTTQAPVTSGAVTTPLPTGDLAIESAASFDPFGGGGENDALIPNLIDNSSSTAWRTETYSSPLSELKPGVGVTAAVTGTPGQIQLIGFSQGTAFEVRWSPDIAEDPGDWEQIAAGRAPAGTTSVDLPARTDGHWLLWLTELPVQADGSHYSALSELRFRQ
jgi:eukaryotic-like serine/threonine-protein kinase